MSKKKSKSREYKIGDVVSCSVVMRRNKEGRNCKNIFWEFVPAVEEFLAIYVGEKIIYDGRVEHDMEYGNSWTIAKRLAPVARVRRGLQNVEILVPYAALKISLTKLEFPIRFCQQYPYEEHERYLNRYRCRICGKFVSKPDFNCPVHTIGGKDGKS